MSPEIRRLFALLLVPLALAISGTLGYYFIEDDYSLFDALYMTVITLTTVGYGETRPLSDAGRSFTICLLLGGVFMLAYAASELIRIVVNGEIQKAVGKRAMEKNLAELKRHIIVCGYGRMGKLVCEKLSAERLPFVVIDRFPALLQDFQIAHGIPLVGDGTSDEVLRHAGIDRARALITVAASDADNLFITMSARLLNDKLFIVARSESEASQAKLMRAGANRVVCPYTIGGSSVAHAVLRPTVVDFIELATRTDHLDLQIEEIHLAGESKLIGQTLGGSQLRKEVDVIVVAIKQKSGKMVYNPRSDHAFQAGDILITLGPRKELDRLEQFAGVKTASA